MTTPDQIFGKEQQSELIYDSEIKSTTGGMNYQAKIFRLFEGNVLIMTAIDTIGEQGASIDIAFSLSDSEIERIDEASAHMQSLFPNSLANLIQHNVAFGSYGGASTAGFNYPKPVVGLVRTDLVNKIRVKQVNKEITLEPQKSKGLLSGLGSLIRRGNEFIDSTSRTVLTREESAELVGLINIKLVADGANVVGEIKNIPDTDDNRIRNLIQKILA